MTPEERVIALEREMEDTRRAAVMLILGIVEAVATTPDGREDLAQGFDEVAGEADHVTARLARLVAAAIRR